MKKSQLFILLLLITVFSCKTKETIIYVSLAGSNDNAGTKELPIKTIEKALQNAKEIRKNSNEHIRINVMEGDYYLSSTLVLTPELNNISIVGEGLDKVRIKGSKIINSNWKPYSENIWVTNVREEVDFNQLFINGEKQILARYPNYDDNGGYWQGHAEDVISKERIATWNNPINGFVHAMHQGRWGGFHYEIKGVSDDGELELIGGHQNNRPSAMHKKYRMVENVFEELNSEKEWYFNKATKQLFLWNESKIDLNKALVEVSVLKHLIEIKGTEQNPVKNIIIEGISFQNTKRTFMEEYQPLLRSDWTIYRGGALLLDGTENCSINRCEFTNLGGNVIFANGYNRNISITGNHIHDCGASAISFVGDASAVRSPSYQYKEFVPIEDMDTEVGPANNLYPANCIVENNLIHRIGRIEKQVAGIQISMAMKIHVKSNSIYDVPRAGINVSEGTWGGHIIEYNDVFNTVLETSDHGSFNSWGRDRFWHPNRGVMDSLTLANPKMPLWDAMYTTIIRNNRFRCDHGWDIDLDDGSTNYKIYNNLCLNRGIKLREGFYRVVENNIMVNNSFHPHVWFSNSEDVFTKNIMMKKYADIRLNAWGKELDYNLFPNEAALKSAQKNGTDKHSLYGDAMFINPEKGDFTVAENSPALTLGFKNFPMDSFGVQKKELKAIAKQPKIPELNILSSKEEKTSTKEWLGATLKNIQTIEEQSSYGTHSMDGIIILKVDKNSKLSKSLIKEGDVIIGIEKEKVKNISNFIDTYKKYDFSENTTFNIVRNQKEIEVEFKK